MIDNHIMGVALGLVVLSLAFATGPVRFPVRAALRGFGPQVAKRFERPVLVGLFAGMAGAILLSPLLGVSPVLITALALLALLAASDASWRWLPPIWTLLLAGIGVILLIYNDTPALRLLEAAVVATLLLGLRQTFLWLRGTEALGLGDVWLAGAVALHLGAPLTFQVLGLAAGLGLLGCALSPYLFAPTRRRLGVAFGTHICFISAIYICWFPFFPISTYS